MRKGGFCFLVKKDVTIAEKFGYQELIQEMQLRTGYSYYRVQTILKELSRLLQTSIRKGYPVECTGLCVLEFTSKGYVIVSGEFYDSLKQAQDLALVVNLDLNTTTNFVNTYYSIIKTKIEQGFKVNIKGVCYIFPRVDGDLIYIDSRISPQLKKPEVTEFVVFKKETPSEVSSKIFEGDKLRLSMRLDSQLRVPNNIFSVNSYQPEYIALDSE